MRGRDSLGRTNFGTRPLLLPEAVLGGVALGALMLGWASSARADDICTINGTVVTCAGDQSKGISITGGPLSTLIVENIVGDIEPWPGVSGIRFDAEGSVTLTGETGDWQIETEGAFGHGIHLSSFGSTTYDVSLNHVGDIFAEGAKGILATGWGDVSSVIAGDIDALDNAIELQSLQEGTVTVDHTGKLTSRQGVGVYASAYGAVDITTNGFITSTSDGIFGNSTGDSVGSMVTIDHTGGIVSAEGKGIYAYSAYQGVSVTNDGSINSLEDGIFAGGTSNDVNSEVVVDNTGNITSYEGKGIYAFSANSKAQVLNKGDVDALYDGIFAKSTGNTAASTASVEHEGSITSYEGMGIFAESIERGASIDSKGAVIAKLDAVIASSTGTDASSTSTVLHVGSVTSYNARGVVATSSWQGVDIATEGTIVVKEEAIYARSFGSTAGATVEVDHTGSITSYIDRGVHAESSGAAVVVTVAGGDISSKLDGVYARSAGDEANATVTVDVTGNITASGDGTTGRGVFAQSPGGAVSVTVVGNVTGKQDGVYARTFGDAESATATIDVNGNIVAYGNSNNEGIGAYAEASWGAASVTVDGDITAKREGVYVRSTGSFGTSTATADVEGNIISYDRYGIFAEAVKEGVKIDMVGNITSKLDGLYANATGDRVTSTIEIDNAGNITSYSGSGIYATADNATVDIYNRGAILANTYGIYANTPGNPSGALAKVDHVGNITAYDEIAISAQSSTGGVNILSVGDFWGNMGGINAVSTGNTTTSTVTVNHDGNIVAPNGSGIYAMATSKAVGVTMDGDINGGGDYGIFAEAKTTDVTVDYLGGTISGMVNAGVYMRSIESATLNNYGVIDALSGDAVTIEGFGDNIVNNYGTITGELDLTGSSNLFANMEDARLNLGSFSQFNDWGLLTNAGVLAPGGGANVWDSHITGDYTQSATGTLLIDIDFGNSVSDRVAVWGDAALEGEIAVALPDLDSVVPGSYSVLTSGGLTERSLVVANAALDASIEYVNDTDVVLNVVGIDFAANGLNDNQTAVGESLTNAFDNGSSSLDPLFLALANVMDTEEYAAALDQLSPQGYGDAVAATQLNNLAFADQMLSCRVNDGANVFTAEGQCAWVAAGASVLQLETLGYDQTSYNLAAGTQLVLGEDWRLGGAVGYAQSSGSSALGTVTDGEQLHGGAVLKYDRDAMLFAAAVTGGYGMQETTRQVEINNIVETLTGTGDIGFLAGRLHGAYTMQMGDTYFKPMATLDLTQFSYGGFTESGGSTSLAVADGNHLVAIVNPAVELGGQFVLADGTSWRPFIKAGLSLSSGSQVEVTSQFTEGSGDAFTVNSGGDDMLGKLSGGIDVVTAGDFSIKAFYEGAFGETTTRHGGAIKVGASF
jgi:hypothetical protein